MSVLDHAEQVQKLLDNPHATIYFFSPGGKQWKIIKEATWSKTLKYLVVLPEHKHLMEALIAGKLEMFLYKHNQEINTNFYMHNYPLGSWRDVEKDEVPDFEKERYRVKHFSEFTIRPDSLELEKLLQQAENDSDTGVIYVSSLVISGVE